MSNPLTPAERAALRAHHTPPPCPVCGVLMTAGYFGGYLFCPHNAGDEDHYEKSKRAIGADPAVLRLLDENDALRAALQQELREWQHEARHAERECEAPDFDPMRDACPHCWAVDKVGRFEGLLKGAADGP